MARGTIITRTLGTIESHDDGTFDIITRGKQPKRFESKEDAEVYLQKHGEKRYDTVIRINGKQQWRTFSRKKDAEDYLDRNSTDARDGTYREIIPATFTQYADRWRKNISFLKS